MHKDNPTNQPRPRPRWWIDHLVQAAPELLLQTLALTEPSWPGRDDEWGAWRDIGGEAGGA